MCGVSYCLLSSHHLFFSSHCLFYSFVVSTQIYLTYIYEPISAYKYTTCFLPHLIYYLVIIFFCKFYFSLYLNKIPLCIYFNYPFIFWWTLDYIQFLLLLLKNNLVYICIYVYIYIDIYWHFQSLLLLVLFSILNHHCSLKFYEIYLNILLDSFI